jgi:predicted nucleic acid-binding protein
VVYVLDTSAVMSLLRDEPGAEQVEAILEGDEHVALPFIALMELRYALLRELPQARVDYLLDMLVLSRVEIPESSPEWGRRAAEVKAGGGLSLADAWIAALALMRNAELVHKDPEFDRVAGLRAIKLSG